MSERAVLLSVYSCSHSRQLPLEWQRRWRLPAECKLDESRCALCTRTEGFRARHTHPSQWSCELQQFLHQYSSIDMTRCVCRPCYSDLRRGLRGKYPVGQAFTPRWQVREEKKKGRQNPLCCIPGKIICAKSVRHHVARLDHAPQRTDCCGQTTGSRNVALSQ